MSSIQNKINKSLVIHNLQNLVFEKRQRKTVQHVPLPIFKKPSPKPSHKKKISPKPVNVPAKNKSVPKPKKKRVIVKKPKKIQEPKVHKKLSQNKSEESVEKIKEQEEEEEIIEESLSESSEEDFQIGRKKRNISKPKTLKLPQKKNQSRPEKSVEADKKVEPQVSTKQKVIEKVQLKKEEKEQEPEEKQNEEDEKEKEKKARGRPKKQKVDIIKQEESQEQSEQFPPPIEQIFQHSPEQNENPVQETNQRSRRVRQAKISIRYNQNEEEYLSDESMQEGRQFKRKRKIVKYKSKNRNCQSYKLNRIFRKEAKKNFPVFQVKVDLNQLSLPYFVKQFGMFDLIHFSLPLKFLHLLEDIPLILQKGFIFVWVEQKQTQLGYHLLNRWGFDVIDQIIWVKANEEEGKIQTDKSLPYQLVGAERDSRSDDLFVNMKSTCLVGYKCPLGNKAEYRTKVSNNIIFAKPQKGCRKPAQIYEIADLMMPGAKKLQFGGSSQKGWLNLKHIEKNLFRCHSCFRQESLYLLSGQCDKFVQCKKCIVDEINSENELNIEEISQIYDSIVKTQIDKIFYISGTQTLKCQYCGKCDKDLKSTALIRSPSAQNVMCLQCFWTQTSQNEVVAKIDIILKKKIVYNQAHLNCSNCNQITLFDSYFQCQKSKNFKVCKKCFWKTSQDPKINQIQADKRIGKSSMHEWKLRFVKNSPLMKFTCFSCKVELSIPFWSCQTCQSWAWCGRCDKGTSETHPHYQNGEHKQYLVI